MKLIAMLLMLAGLSWGEFTTNFCVVTINGVDSNWDYRGMYDGSPYFAPTTNDYPSIYEGDGTWRYVDANTNLVEGIVDPSFYPWDVPWTTITVKQGFNPETSVIAMRPDVNRWVPTAWLPYATYTNAAVWIPFASPIINAGTTNALWVGYSPNRNGARQTVLNSQPTRVYSNETWRALFDGTDDFITSAYAGNPDNFRLTIRMRPAAIPAAYAAYIAGQYRTGDNSRMWTLSQRAAGDSGEMRILTSSDGTSSTYASIAQASISSNMATYVWTKIGTNVACTVSGTAVTVTGNAEGTLADKAAPMIVGALAAGASPWAGQIEFVIFEVLP